MRAGQTQSSDDASEIREIERMLEVGQISLEGAQRRVMAFYQRVLGGSIRSLGEIRPDIIPSLIARLQRDLTGISRQYQEEPGAKREAETSSRAVPIAPRLKNKSDDILLRERIVVSALIKTDQVLTFNEVKDLVTAADPAVNVPSIVANLDRLAKDELIARPRKGYYSSSSASRGYLAALQDEIEARGLAQR